jgi:hypothetical protein
MMKTKWVGAPELRTARELSPKPGGLARFSLERRNRNEAMITYM